MSTRTMPDRIPALPRAHLMEGQFDVGGRTVRSRCIVVLLDATGGVPAAGWLSAAAGPAAGGLPPGKLRRLEAHVRDNWPGGGSVAELAAVAGLSRHHFCRVFKEATGLSPHNWLIARRVAWSMADMARGGKRLAEVALDAGFSSQQHFCTAFRRHTGTTPTAWRRLAASHATAECLPVGVGRDAERRPESAGEVRVA